MIQSDTSRLSPLSLEEVYAPIENDLKLAASIFDEELATDIPFIAELCVRVQSYRGKMLRPALLLLAGKASGAITPNHAVLAAVVEMVHMATLVHDDVLDEADVRRKQATVNSDAGNVTAVLLGDYLISHAFHLCSSLDSQYASRLIGAATNTVCTGEMLQNHHRNDLTLDEATYFRIVSGKTGALTAAACELGAKFAGLDDSGVAFLRHFGMQTGIAFQIVDDLLDLQGDQGVVGKSLGRDALLGKLTLPAIHCLANGGPAVVEGLSRVLQSSHEDDRAELLGYLAETDSIAYARGVAQQRVSDACAALGFLPESDAKSSLVSMAEFVTRRVW